MIFGKRKKEKELIRKLSFVNDLFNIYFLASYVIANGIIAIASTSVLHTAHIFSVEAIRKCTNNFIAYSVIGFVIAVILHVINNLFTEKKNKNALIVLLVIGIIWVIASLFVILSVYF